MGNKIVDIVDEFRTVANAMDGVNTFIYDRLSAINARKDTKAYPAILLESTPQSTVGKLNTSFLPRGKSYRFRMFVFSDYSKEEQKTVSLAQKESDNEDILNRYMAEIIERNLSNPDILIDQPQLITGLIAHDVQNARLVQSSVTITIIVTSDCVTGTFNY